MLNYILKRLLGLIPTLFIVAVLVFLFVHLLPGDPARLIAGPEADAQVIELVRQQRRLAPPGLGGDPQPVYAYAVADVDQYDLGRSVRYGGGDCRGGMA